jgi:hypothetical protein
MNRWITSVSFAVLAVLAACQAGADQTTDVEQAVATSGDCIPGGNFTGAVAPPLPLWNGYKPTPQPGQILMDVADWRANTQSSGVGFHVAVLADPGTGKIVWGATVPDGKVASFRTGGIQPQIGDCCRPPPGCCRGCCDKWMPANLLEAALRYLPVADNAEAAAGKPYP